jgi:hypothetical protein
MLWMARIGYGSRGVVYLLVGAFAVLAGIGAGGETGGSRSALTVLLGQPFGHVLVGLLAMGLACFAAWRLVEAWTDADHRGRSAKGTAVRLAHAASGLIYGSLAATAAAMAILGARGNTDDDRSARDWSAWLLHQPFGRYVVIAVGLGVVVTGLAFLRRAASRDLLRRLDVPQASRAVVSAAGRLGHAARGLVFVVMGGFLVAAGWTSRSSQAKGLGGALDTLRDQPYGWALLTAVAAGLVCFGLFGIMQARFRRLDAPPLGRLEGV